PLAELLQQKETLFEELQGLQKDLESQKVSPADYETALRQRIDRLAEIDQAIEGHSGEALLSERVTALEKALQGVEAAAQRPAVMQYTASSADVDTLREAVAGLGEEFRENLTQLLEVDAKTLDRVRELQTYVAGGKVEQIEAQIRKIEELYREFISEDRLQEFIRTIRATIAAEDLPPLAASIRTVKEGLEASIGKAEQALERGFSTLEEKLGVVRVQMEELRQEALQFQVEQFLPLEKRLEEIATGFPPVREEVFRLAGALEELVFRSRPRSPGELDRQREELQATLDTLRGAHETGALPPDEYEKRAAPLRRKLDLLEAQHQEHLQRLELLGRIQAQEETGRSVLAATRDLPRAPEIRGWLDDLRQAIRREEMTELRETVEWFRASLRLRLETIPQELDERLSRYEEHLRGGVDPRQIEDTLTRTREQARSQVQGALHDIQEEVRREVARGLQRGFDDLHRAAEEKRLWEDWVSTGLADRLRTIEKRLQEAAGSMESYGRSQRLEAREVHGLRQEVEAMAQRMGRPPLTTLLKQKEDLLLALERLRIERSEGLATQEHFEAQVRRKVAQVAEIDEKLEEAAKLDAILARLDQADGRLQSIEKTQVAVQEFGPRFLDTVSRQVLEKTASYVEQRLRTVQSLLEARILEKEAEKRKTPAARPRAFIGGEERKPEASPPPQATEAPPPGATRQEVEKIIEDRFEEVARELSRLRERLSGLAPVDEERFHELEKKVLRLPIELEARLRQAQLPHRELAALRAELDTLRRFLPASPGRRGLHSIEELRAERDRLKGELSRLGGAG
ncbi:MAG: hypothetical protein HY558_05015, partial [Euryarchaeota archaeon]|nr:hypothetical protein [Euryarchaeota archaeon]